MTQKNEPNPNARRAKERQDQESGAVLPNGGAVSEVWRKRLAQRAGRSLSDRLMEMLDRESDDEVYKLTGRELKRIIINVRIEGIQKMMVRGLEELGD